MGERPPLAVSYTHLDVYKRQSWCGVGRRYLLFPACDGWAVRQGRYRRNAVAMRAGGMRQSGRARWKAHGGCGVACLRQMRCHKTVSYTHLDVYKRQDEYRNADMLLFVSTYEGFGLPIVEANAVGRPVVTSQISSMPEVAADAACLVDPYDVASIRHGVQRVIENAAYRNELIQRGYVNAMRFSQEVVAARYAEVYRDVASASRRQNQDGIN